MLTLTPEFRWGHMYHSTSVMADPDLHFDMYGAYRETLKIVWP
jgi:hypothetical protein